MLIQFSIQNFKTFKEKATLSFIASNYDKTSMEEDNVLYESAFDLRILKSAVVYGANASGKSKLTEAMRFMQRFMLSSLNDSQIVEQINVQPFLLSTDTEKKGSEFEIIFLYNGVIYRYGFEVDHKKVLAEWLYVRPKTKEIQLFYRDQESFDIHPRSFSKGARLVKEGLIRENALFLSVCAQFNETYSISILEWINELTVLNDWQRFNHQMFTVQLAKASEQNKKVILDLFRAADLGIEDILFKSTEWIAVNPLIGEEAYRAIDDIKLGGQPYFSPIYTRHFKYDINNKKVGQVDFTLTVDESSGTQKFFALTGFLLAALNNGSVLMLDELDTQMHPNLVASIVSIFNSKSGNPLNSQLVFTAHDTNLLNTDLFRRDQIWFTEKDKYGASTLYSLADFKSEEVRKGESFEENYIRGKYGAVPYLGFFDELNDHKNLAVS